MAFLSDAKEFIALLGSIKSGTESLSNAKEQCRALKESLSRSAREFRDLKIENSRRGARVHEFYSLLSASKSGVGTLRNVFQQDLISAPTTSPPQPNISTNSSPTTTTTASTTTTPSLPPPANDDSLRQDDAKSEFRLSEWWLCIGQQSIEQQVVSDASDYVLASSSMAICSDESIPSEAEAEAYAPNHKDVFNLLVKMQALSQQAEDTTKVIESFERDFLSPAVLDLGVPQEVVLHLIRGQPYQQEFADEEAGLAAAWVEVKEARDQVDKNSKDSGEALMDAVGETLMAMQTDLQENVEDLSTNVAKILELISETNKTLSLSLSEQAARRKKTVREKIFSTVVSSEIQTAENLAFLRDVCQEYRGQTDVLDWVHPTVGVTPSFYASLRALDDILEIFGSNGANVDMIMPSTSAAGWTCLTIAASRGWSATVRMLMKIGCDLSIANETTGQTAFHYATLKGDISTLSVLIDAPLGKIHLDTVCAKGRSPIHSAIELLASQSPETLRQREGVLQCISKLLDNGARPSPEAVALAATKANCLAALQLILEHPKVDSGLKDSYLEGRGTILYLAVEEKNLVGLEFLIKAGANANKITGVRKSSPIMLAIASNDANALAILLTSRNLVLENETMLTTKEGTSVFHLAVEKNHIAILSLLLDKMEKKQNLINQPDKLGRTPLLCAVQLGLFSACERLVAADANVDACDLEQRTPAMAATERGYFAILVLLAKNGADLRKPCGILGTPLESIRVQLSEYEIEDDGDDVQDVLALEEAEDEGERLLQIKKLLEILAQPLHHMDKSKCECIVC